MRLRRLACLAAPAVAALLAAPSFAAPEKITVSGEPIDTWCYFSGVMGGPDSVTGSSHHACALWCAAGGIPVGLLADDGTVYMVLKWEGEDDVAGGEMILDAQSHRITASGTVFRRDGVNYILVEEILSDEGIVNLTHEDYDVVPPFAIPKPKKGGG